MDVDVIVAVFVDITGRHNGFTNAGVGGRGLKLPVSLARQGSVGALKEPERPAPKEPVLLSGSVMMCSS